MVPSTTNQSAASANARTRCNNRILNDTTVFAFGTYFGATAEPSPYEKIFHAVLFVSGCLYPGSDVLKFLLPDQVKSNARKKKIELTAKPKWIDSKEWFLVQATATELIQRNQRIHQKFGDGTVKKFMKKLKEHTNWCQNIYAYMAFALNLRSTSQRETLHEQVVLRLNRTDINSDAALSRTIAKYSPQSIRELADGGEFDKVGVTKRIYPTRGYTVLLKVLEKYNLDYEEATIEDLQKLADEAKARKSVHSADTATGSDTKPAARPTRVTRSLAQTDSKDTVLATDTAQSHAQSGTKGPNRYLASVVGGAVSDTNTEDSSSPAQPRGNCEATVVSGVSDDEESKTVGQDDFDDLSDNESTTTIESIESETDVYVPLNETVANGGTVRRLAKKSGKARAARPRKPGSSQAKTGKTKDKDVDSFIDSRVNSETAAEKDGPTTAAAAVNADRKAFNEAWLFNESTEQHLCFEQPRDGCRGTDGPSVFEVIKTGQDDTTVLRDREVLAACHDIAVGSMHMYMFNESSHVQHMELTSEESELLAETCRDSDVAYHYYPRKGMSNDSDFIKVSQKDSDEWHEVMEDLQLNAPQIVECMLELDKNGDKSVVADSDDKRKSLHFDGGFACQAWNHQESPEEAETTASFPVLIHEPRPNRPKEYGLLYHHVGDVLDRLQDYVDRRGQENGNRPMADDFRTEKAGKKLREACGAERSRFEAFTVGITIMGTVEEYQKSQSFDKKHKIGRHRDGPNDNRRGYQWTAVFGVLLVVNGIIYRLAIIAYTRKSVGDAIEKEVQCFQVVKEILDAWLLNRTTLQDVDLKNDGEAFEYSYDADGERFREKGRRYPSFADPHGGWAAVIYAIECLGKTRTDLPRAFWTELLLVILRHNSPMMLKHIFLRWLPNAAAAKRFEESISSAYGPHTLFKLECEHSGIKPQNGKCPRMQWSNAGWWPNARDEHDRVSISNDIETMEGILRDAENHIYLHKDIMKRVEQIKGIGPVKALPFYLIATQAGYLISKHAKRESYFAQLSDKNPGAQMLEQTNGSNLSLQGTFKRFAWLYELEEYIMENVLCKKYRGAAFCWDYIAEGQTIYSKVKVRNKINQERTVFLKKEWNAPWQEYTPRLPGFHDNP